MIFDDKIPCHVVITALVTSSSRRAIKRTLAAHGTARPIPPGSPRSSGSLQHRPCPRAPAARLTARCAAPRPAPWRPTMCTFTSISRCGNRLSFRARTLEFYGPTCPKSGAYTSLTSRAIRIRSDTSSVYLLISIPGGTYILLLGTSDCDVRVESAARAAVHEDNSLVLRTRILSTCYSYSNLSLMRVPVYLVGTSTSRSSASKKKVAPW